MRLEGEGPDLNICFLCGATVGGILNRMAANLGSQWRRTFLSHQDYMNQRIRARGFVSEIWNLPGFHYLFLALDLMHMGCLGIVQYLCGNCLLRLFFKLEGILDDPNDGLGRLQTFIKIGAEGAGVQIPVFKISIGMIKGQGNDPKFKGKAAESRHISFCCLRFSSQKTTTIDSF